MATKKAEQEKVPEAKAEVPEDERNGDVSEQDKAAVARQETNGEPRKVKWHDIELELPAEVPEELMFDIVEMEANDSDPFPVFRLLRTLVGPDQFVTIRNQITALPAESKEGDNSPTTELVELVLSQYGVDLGES